MSSRAEELAAKRRALQLRCMIEREDLRHYHADVGLRLRNVDRLLGIARGVIRHPLLIGVAMTGIALIGPLKILRWVGRSVFFWQAARRLGGYFMRNDS